MLSEFDLIRRYFTAVGAARDDVRLGVGDDGALLQPRGDELLAVTTDTLIAGVHFPEDAPVESIGHKALAVNLSDLAAMGAEPAWFTLSLSIPGADEAWLADFARGLSGLAYAQGVSLVGGDTVRGPLSITVTALGFVPGAQALKRSGARPGDQIYVTGTLGDAARGLDLARGRQHVLPDRDHRFLLDRLHRPSPRCDIGIGLRRLASACIDISDGLAADLGHLCAASGVGARVALARLPLSPACRLAAGDAFAPAVSGGDDYELCFTAPPACATEILALADAACPITRIGVIEAVPGLRFVQPDGAAFVPSTAGYDHFA